MAKSSLSSWSEGASTLPPRNSDSGNSTSSNYSTDDSESVAESESSSSSASEPPWIIPYLLESRLPNELPLRTMFAFNSGQPLSSLKETYGWWNSRKDGRNIIEFFSSLDKITPTATEARILNLENPAEPFPDFAELHCPYDRFMDSGNENLLKLDNIQDAASSRRRASQGLPPDFVEKMILSTIFRSEYKDVEFQHALTGLDYLRDLEMTRRCCLREAAMRLEITVDNWRNVLAVNMGALEWVEAVLHKEKVIEAYYARIYVNIRIWIMVNELRQPSFYKPNVLALLNTLFPPGNEELPNNRVLVSMLHQHRASLYHYMLAIEAGSNEPLENFVSKHLRIGTSYSWPETRLQLEKYMELADSMIEQSRSVHAVEFFQPHPNPRRREVIDGELAPRLAPVKAPQDSFDSETSSGPRTSSGTIGIRARSNARRQPRPTILHGIHFNDPTEPYSSSFPVNAPEFGLAASSSPENSSLSEPKLSTDNAPPTSTQSSPLKYVSYSPSQRGDSFDSPKPESPYQDYFGFGDTSVTSTPPLMSGAIDPLGIQHRRSNSSGNSRGSQKLRASNDYRRNLPRRDSALRNMELPPDNIGFSSHPYPSSRTPLASPNPSPPKLNKKSSIGKFFVRNAKSATHLKQSFNSKNDASPIPNASIFERHSISASRPSFTMGNPLGIFTNASERSPSVDQQRGLEIKLSPTKIATPLLEHTEFTGIQPEFAPRSTPRQKQNSNFAHLAKPKHSPGALGRRERAFIPPPTPEYTDPALPFERFPGNNPVKQKPQLKKQRSFGFLEATKRKERPAKPKSKSPTLVPTSAFAASSPFIGLEVAVKKDLKKKSSMSTLFLSESPKVEDDGVQYWETNDPNERLIITKSVTPKSKSVNQMLADAFSPTRSSRPFTPDPTTVRSSKLSSTRKSLRAAKSDLSLRTTTPTPTSSPHIGTPKSYLTTPRKLLNKLSRDRVLTSADISEPFPPSLQKAASKHQADGNFNPDTPIRESEAPPDLSTLPPYAPGGQKALSRTYLPPTTESIEEFQRKEYTRTWFLEESRARKYDLKKPAGGPFPRGDETKSEGFLTFFRREPTVPIQDMAAPRASRKKIERPEGRRRQGGLFEEEPWESRWRREKGKEKLKHTAMDVGKYDRY